ncbi:MAG TPA: HAMP domain-containing sensor histidine kinase [Cyclobacteriaceae bacterium]|nr:HAMP domain-containing sensor histidine kinase [Cyclobacteriaceae bacterium]
MSFWSQVTTGSSLFYFPMPFALILCCWWGLRVLPAFYLNATVSAGVWGLEYPWLYPVYAFPETLFIFISWLLFIKVARGKSWLPDAKEILNFLTMGICVPLIIYKPLLEGIFAWTGQIPAKQFWPLTITTSLGDFISIFGITIPVLYFATGRMQRMGLTKIQQVLPSRSNHLKEKFKSHVIKIEFLILSFAVLVASQTIAFSDYWFLYGVMSLYTAIRYGFGVTVLVNSFILLLTYVMPAATDYRFMEEMIMGNEMVRVQIGTGLLYVFSTITGRVMSDASFYQSQLLDQKMELEHTNKELDRFVYSVSHDLSAPLKSIRGLVTLGRLEPMNQQLNTYINHIETSVNKLDDFIAEILDYSRSERRAVVYEPVNLKSLCDEVLDDLKFLPGYNKIQIDDGELATEPVVTDQMRLKIILTNLLSNSIKFHRTQIGNSCYIRIKSHLTQEHLVIKVQDNGEGIKPELQDKIFDMFFRASSTSKGSGLGLYIVKETVQRLGGIISVESKYGEGSTFTIKLPLHPKAPDATPEATEKFND